jgi:DNA-binding NarL/FixJ family response regulator
MNALKSPATTKLKTIRVIIVDDHEVVRIGLRAVLNLTPGIRVVGQTALMKEATSLCLRLQPDLALLDIRLPDGSGIEAARAILSSSPGTKVLFLTSFADSHTVTEAILSGAHGYVLKDISSEGLVRAIRTIAAGHTLIGRSLATMAHDSSLLDETDQTPLAFSPGATAVAIDCGWSDQQGDRHRPPPKRENGEELPGQAVYKAQDRETVPARRLLRGQL